MDKKENEERWVPAKDFEAYYEVSDLGMVRSKMDKTIVTPYERPDGYFMVPLKKNGVRVLTYLHKLVFESFNERNRKDNRKLRFADNRRGNCRLDNLFVHQKKGVAAKIRDGVSEAEEENRMLRGDIIGLKHKITNLEAELKESRIGKENLVTGMRKMEREYDEKIKRLNELADKELIATSRQRTEFRETIAKLEKRVGELAPEEEKHTGVTGPGMNEIH